MIWIVIGKMIIMPNVGIVSAWSWWSCWVATPRIARVTALQYAVAPVILSLTMTVAIGFAICDDYNNNVSLIVSPAAVHIEFVALTRPPRRDVE